MKDRKFAGWVVQFARCNTVQIDPNPQQSRPNVSQDKFSKKMSASG
jgi:hypothetical protein